MVDLSKIRVGDSVDCRFVVEMTRFQWSGRKEFTAQSSAGSIDIPADAIVAHHPKALSVGDKVDFSSAQPGNPGIICAIHDGRAWVRWHRGDDSIVKLDRLEAL